MTINGRIFAAVALAVAATFAQTAQAAISYSVGGWGPTQFPSPTTPPANAPWGVNGYPGDTVEFEAYAGSLDLTPGSVVQKINTLHWTIDYTYGGTATDPNDWSDLAFGFDALRSISFGGTPYGAIGQSGALSVTWDNDYLSLAQGSTVTFFVDGYKVDVTPLGLASVGGTNFDGDNPWVQPTRDVMARFDVSVAAVPEPSSIAVWSLLALTLGGAGWWRRRKQAR